MERAAKYCGHVFPASSHPHPAMTYLQSALAEEQNLINAVDLLNLRSDCQGLRVIIGSVSAVNIQDFSLQLNLFNFLKILYWSIIALQCYIHFCCTAKWVSCKYTCISFLLRLPPASGPIPPSRPSRSTKLSPLGIQRLPESCLLYTGQCMYVSADLSSSPLPCTTLGPPVFTLCLYSCQGFHFAEEKIEFHCISQPQSCILSSL